MGRIRSDGTMVESKGGANLRCPQCGGITKVRTTWGAGRIVIRERWCTDNNAHRFLSTEKFSAWRADAIVSKKKPYHIQLRGAAPALKRVVAEGE